MKKSYIYLFLFFASVFVTFNGKSQNCTVDPTVLNDPGIHPDSVTNFVSGTVGIAYLQNITVVVPQDTQVLPWPFPALAYDSVHMVGINNLPPGLSYMCAGTSSPTSLCTWLGNTNGCAAIYGTPTTAGTYTLSIPVNAYLGGSTAPNAFTISYYKIVINPNSVGLQENGNVNFNVKQNSPNPFSGKTNINVTVPADDKLKISVYNMLGKIVMERKTDASKGQNEIEFDATGLPGGIYFYNVEYKGKTVTRKMMVNN